MLDRNGSYMGNAAKEEISPPSSSGIQETSEPKEPPPPPDGQKINDAISILLAEINSIVFALDSLEETIQSRLDQTAKSVTAFFKKNKAKIKFIEETKDRFKIEMPHELGPDLMTVLKARSTVEAGDRSLRKAILLALVSHWDTFISILLKTILEMYPGIIDASGRSVTFSELQQYGSIADAREAMVDAEVESVIRENHAYHFDYISKKFSLILKPREQAWHQFIEIMERRNLVAHTSGIVSRSYLRNCKTYGISLSKSQTLGSRLHIDRKYLLAACDCLTEMGIELGHVIWRKCLPAEQEDAERHYHRVTYELIEGGRYDVAICLLEFALKPPLKYSLTSDRLVDVINLSQAYKWSGDAAKSKAVLDHEDWSAVSPKFTLAVAVLKDDFEKAATIMEAIGPNGEVARSAYDSWPLFRKFRESSEFTAAYQKVFGRFTEVKELSAEEVGALSLAGKPAAARKRKSQPKTA
jgi:hypothetical protein